MIKYILITVFIGLCFVSILSAQQTMQDLIYLKNGSIIKGQIIEVMSNQTVKIQTSDGSIFVYKTDEIERILKEPVKIAKIKELKSPGIAFVMSMLVPGLGQIYNGQVGKGIGQFLMAGTGAVLMIAQSEGISLITNETKERYTFWLGAVLYSVTWLWSIVDAPTSAARINMTNQSGQSNIFNYRKNNYGLGFDIGPSNRGVAVQLSFYF